ncbi:hypothetical protein MD535_01395 [Vibrio sp. ZSDZ65]|uniref:SPOR domain-containing protein n=1 Tax=Vibrio qingdaonensis TaxID=2829491 RepID=A0A9X3CJW8_9VIBR|nr:hypothetical protein [Vibrio qingdaonensis]MCW8344681.1 hypothetical protein [Vibrio qingdaonensis]
MFKSDEVVVNFPHRVFSSKTVKLIALASLSVSGVANALEVMNADEKTQLEKISSDYDNGYLQTGLEESNETYTQLFSNIESIKINLVNNIENIKVDSASMEKKLVDGVYDESLSQTLRDLAMSIGKLKTELVDKEKQLSEKKVAISKSEAVIKGLDRTKNEELLALYKQVKSRYIVESRKVNQETFVGSLECDSSESMSACVNRNMNTMKRTFMLEKGGLERVNITSFTIVDATQKMNGDLTYTAQASYKNEFDSNTELELRKALGLEKVRFVFRSNSNNTVFYINVQKVGAGDKVDVAGNYVGVYNVRAVNDSKTQSLKLSLKNEGDYFFPFSSVKTKATPSPVKADATAKKTVKTSTDKSPSSAPALTKQILDGYAKSTPEKTQEADALVGKRFTNTVIHKDDAYQYLLPIEYSNNGSKAVYLTKSDAARYCADKLSSKLASRTAYQYLLNGNKLGIGNYWLSSGKVFSSTLDENATKKITKNKFVCMMNMTENW